MTPSLLIFLGAMIYLGWALVRYMKGRTHTETPFIEVLEDEPKPKPKNVRVKKAKDSDSEREWRKRVKDEIEDMTK